MSEIQHPSLKAELLYLIGRASAPLSCAELYEKCELAEEIAKVAKALNNLQSDKNIVPIKGEGGTRYKLADGVAATAPAGKVGRPPVADPDAAPAAQRAVPKPKPQQKPAPALEIPTLGATPGPRGEQVAKLLDTDAERLADAATARGLDLVEARLADERLADVIIARLKRQLAPTLCELEAAVGMDRLNVHIHIEQVDVHLGGL